MVPDKPDVLQYWDYRRFLRDVYASARAADARFSFRYFARVAGYRAPNFLKRVIEGQRNLTERGVSSLAKALQLGARERACFALLVEFNQAREVPKKQDALRRLRALHRGRGLHVAQHDRCELAGDWLPSAVRGLSALPDFRPTADYVSARVWPQAARSNVERAMELLQREAALEAAVQDTRPADHPEIGDLQPEPPELRSAAAASRNLQVLTHAVEGLERGILSMEDATFDGATLPVARTRVPELREHIQRFVREIAALGAADPAPPDDVYQLHVSFFPLTRRPPASV